MLLMVEKGTRSGTHHSIHRYVRANSKYMKDYDKNKQSSYLKYWGVNNVYGWDMLQKLLQVKTSHLIGISQKATIKIVMKDIFLKFMFNIQRNCMNFIMMYRFYLKE